jgi:hypothetical protein
VGPERLEVGFGGRKVRGAERGHAASMRTVTNVNQSKLPSVGVRATTRALPVRICCGPCNLDDNDIIPSHGYCKKPYRYWTKPL